MRNHSKRLLLASVIGGALLLSVPAIAQKVTMRALKGNPYRDIGGSCVYDREGNVVYTPKGARCRNEQDETPAEAASADSGQYSGISPKLRAELMMLLRGHSHIAKEVAKLRLAVAKDRKADALEASNHVVRELSKQLEREKRVFEKITAELAMRGP